MQPHRTARRSAVPLWLLLLSLDALIACCCGSAWEVSRNTLARHGQWVAAKAGLAERVPFDEIVLTTPQAVARGRLDLGAWCGDHELLLKQPMTPARVSYTARFSGNAFCAFVFNGAPARFEGFLLSSDPAMPSCFFEAAADQRFLRKQPLARPTVQAGQDHDVRLAFDGARARAWVDGQSAGDYATTTTGRLAVGFRGGNGPAMIDNARIDRRDGPPITITFGDEALFAGGVGASLLALTLAQTLLAWRLRRVGRSWLHVQFMLIVTASALLALAVAGLAYCRKAYDGRGFDVDPSVDLMKHPVVVKIIHEIDDAYGNRPKPPGTLRVLLVGTSQTRGLGAARQEDRLDRQLERLLAARRAQGGGKTPRVEVLNAGVTALHAPELLNLYRSKWIRFRPDVTIVNLGNNDQCLHGLTDPNGERYRAALEGFADLGRAAGIRTLFVLEANSPERDVKLDRQHAIMRSVAAAKGIATIDADAWLRRRFAEGFLWRDFVHLSSFGQELLARCLADALEKEGLPRGN